MLWLRMMRLCFVDVDVVVVDDDDDVDDVVLDVEVLDTVC